MKSMHACLIFVHYLFYLIVFFLFYVIMNRSYFKGI